MLINYWGEERVYHHTAPVNMLFALNEGLTICLQEGLEKRFERHKSNSKYFLALLDQAGLKPFVNQKKFKDIDDDEDLDDSPINRRKNGHLKRRRTSKGSDEN